MAQQALLAASASKSSLGINWGDLGMFGLSFLGSNHSAKKNYKYAQALQDRQNAWMEKMSNTAHQREVKDLRAAGLNPILSATGGSGASTPAAGNASFTGPDSVNTALQYHLQRKQQKIEQQNANSNTNISNSTVATNREQQEFLKAQAKTQVATAKQIAEATKWIGPQAVANIGAANAAAYNSIQQGNVAPHTAKKLQKETKVIPKVQRYGINIPKLGPLDVHWNEY